MRAIAVLLLSASLGAQAPQLSTRNSFVQSFEYVWKTVNDKIWDPELGGVNWQAVHDDLLPTIEQAQTITQARAVISEMLSRLRFSHFRVIPGTVYSDLGGGAPSSHGDGTTGIDVRVLDGQAVVSSVEAASPAAKNGVAPGWIVRKIDAEEIAPVIEQFVRNDRGSTLLDFTLRRAVLARLGGLVGENVKIEFLDGHNQPAIKTITRAEPRGQLASVGYLGPSHVWFDTRQLKADKQTIEYITLNLFLDPANVMPEFGSAVQSCLKCDGFIIDLRGNPGGLGGMAAGMAGWFIREKDLRLGTLLLRDTALKFVINPRPETYAGPLAILVDSTSASTAEIFAAGMQDLKRARIFGTRTAGAALPSVIEILPDGDAFQYAIANYVSESGKELEGNGVVPDDEEPLTRPALLSGADPALDAAVQWITAQPPKHD